MIDIVGILKRQKNKEVEVDKGTKTWIGIICLPINPSVQSFLISLSFMEDNF
jgi:hypothetical protein